LCTQPDIFYQLCVGCDAGLKGKLRLAPPNTFSYLNQSGCLEVDGSYWGLLTSSLLLLLMRACRVRSQCRDT
jgi:hypothetical protein